jgi:hypothetical protein
MSKAVDRSVEATDGESLVVTYEINIYSDDGTTAD